MPSGNDCPACGENIGIVAVFKAPVPNRIYCPHCGERLRYGDTDWLLAAAVILLLVAVATGFALVVFLELDAPLALGVVTGVFILSVAAVELACVLILWYGNFRLELVNQPKSACDDEF